MWGSRCFVGLAHELCRKSLGSGSFLTLKSECFVVNNPVVVPGLIHWQVAEEHLEVGLRRVLLADTAQRIMPGKLFRKLVEMQQGWLLDALCRSGIYVTTTRLR